MSYMPKSVKEVMSKINAMQDGWYLPAVQRPYVWGERYESEKYICRLFDSIFQKYPIGMLIVWKTGKIIPHHEFLREYRDGDSTKQVTQDKWGRAEKSLVYDGQQRLQTLYSCLNYSINGRRLIYDVFAKIVEVGDTKFRFIDNNEPLPSGGISMTRLFTCGVSRSNFTKEFRATVETAKYTEQEDEIVDQIDRLWAAFVEEDNKTIALFLLDNDAIYDEEKVNDIFLRLNTGGIPLTGADLLFSVIKQKEPRFEEDLKDASARAAASSNGFVFGEGDILRVLNFLARNTIKVDAAKTKKNEIAQILAHKANVIKAVEDFVKLFLYDQFRINNSSICSKTYALLPLITYIYTQITNGKKYTDISSNNIENMKKYFIYSQLKDWNTQGIVDKVCKECLSSGDFPLDKIIKIAKENNRSEELQANHIQNSRWFLLKLTTPDREYSISLTKSKNRYNPELDHIFPRNPDPAVAPIDYDSGLVDVVWNMQPITGIINADKTNQMPRAFFYGFPQYYSSYHHMPPFNDPTLDNANWSSFIDNRRTKMLNFLENEYKIKIIR